MMRRCSSHPHHPENRQHEYVALPMCSYAPHCRLSSSRSQTHCSLAQSNPSQVRRGRRFVGLCVREEHDMMTPLATLEKQEGERFAREFEILFSQRDFTSMASYYTA